MQCKYCLCPGKDTEITHKLLRHCQIPDKFGEIRPIFADRICNGKVDCFGNEDEDGTMATCQPGTRNTLAVFTVFYINGYLFLLICEASFPVGNRQTYVAPLLIKFEIADALTTNECCSVLVINGEECHSNGEFAGHDYYECVSDPDRVVFSFANRWFIGKI